MFKKALAIISPLLAFALVVSFSGCSYFEKLSPVEYNNQIVEALNTTSELIEETITAYDLDIPDIVTEKSEIDTSDMKTALSEAQKTLSNAAIASKLQSKDQVQQEAVQNEFGSYLSLAQNYLDTYSDTLDYYKSTDYIEDLTLVSDHDTAIYDAYNDFIESNNELVDILESYI